LTSFVSNRVTEMLHGLNEIENERAREGFMFSQLSECMSLHNGPPQAVLNLTTELMRFYPWFLKVSFMMQRLVW
jgi:hypothetical protein